MRMLKIASYKISSSLFFNPLQLASLLVELFYTFQTMLANYRYVRQAEQFQEASYNYMYALHTRKLQLLHYM